MASHRFLPACARDPLARNHRYYLHHTRILTITGLLRRYEGDTFLLRLDNDVRLAVNSKTVVHPPSVNDGFPVYVYLRPRANLCKNPRYDLRSRVGFTRRSAFGGRNSLNSSIIRRRCSRAASGSAMIVLKPSKGMCVREERHTPPPKAAFYPLFGEPANYLRPQVMQPLTSPDRQPLSPNHLQEP